MRSVKQPRIKERELTNAIHVLNRLKRRIDGETEDNITHGEKWFLHSKRTALITKNAMRRLEAVELVTDCLVQWYAILQATKSPLQPKARAGHRKGK